MTSPMKMPGEQVVAESLEAEHQVILQALSEIQDAAETGDSKAMGMALDGLIRSCGRHFAHEEAAISRHPDVATNQHFSSHRQLIARMLRVRAAIERGNDVEAALGNCFSELLNHLDEHDAPAYNKFTARPVEKKAVVVEIRSSGAVEEL